MVVVVSVLVTSFHLASVGVLRVSVPSHLVSLLPRTICVQTMVVAVLLLLMMMTMMRASVHLLLRCLFRSPLCVFLLVAATCCLIVVCFICSTIIVLLSCVKSKKDSSSYLDICAVFLSCVAYLSGKAILSFGFVMVSLTNSA